MDDANRHTSTADLEQLHAPPAAAEPPHEHSASQPHDARSNHQQQQQQRGHKRKQKQKHQKQPNQSQQQQSAGKPRARKLKQPRNVDMPRILAELLSEPKQALLHRVVRIIGPKMAWDLLKETVRVEQQGGQEVNALGSGVPDKFLVEDAQTQEKKPRKRTTGGIFFTLLRDRVPKETYREIYEVENKKKKEAKNRLRYQKKQRFEKEIAQLGFDVLNIEQASAGNANANANSGGDAGGTNPLAGGFQSSYANSDGEEEGEVMELA